MQFEKCLRKCLNTTSNEQEQRQRTEGIEKVERQVGYFECTYSKDNQLTKYYKY